MNSAVRLRDPRPEYDPIKAIEWAAEHCPGHGDQSSEFLRDWLQGQLSVWPEFVAWARKGGDRG